VCGGWCLSCFTELSLSFIHKERIVRHCSIVSVQVAGNVEAKTVISGTLGCFALSATVCHPECAVALLYSSIVFKRSFK
jgi:hypothetical protein